MTPTNSNEDIATAPEQDRGRIAAAGDKLRETASEAKTRASDAYTTARDKTRAAYGTARERAGTTIESNPVGAVIGGLAIGALVAAVLPRSSREAELLGEWGKRLNDGARDAARKAKETGVCKLDEFGVSAAKDKLKELTGAKSGE